MWGVKLRNWSRKQWGVQSGQLENSCRMRILKRGTASNFWNLAHNADHCDRWVPSLAHYFYSTGFPHTFLPKFTNVEDPQWGAADAEIKVPSGENTELKRSPFEAWSRLVYSHTCYAYCQEFLSCLFLHFRSIHLHFFQNLSRFFPVLAVASTWFLCRPAE